MAFNWGGAKNTIPQGICPTCQSILDDEIIPFTLSNQDITDSSIGGRIIINTFGVVNIKRCYMNHEHLTDIEWKGISFSCANCHTQLVNDKDIIRCISCGYDTDFLKLVGIYSIIIDLALSKAQLQTSLHTLTKFFDKEEGLKKWTTLLNGFFDSYRLNPVQEGRTPNLPDLAEYYSNGRIIHNNLKYTALGLLAYGGFSKVYLGKDMHDNYVVIKVPWGYKNEQEKGLEKRINPYNMAEDKIRIESEFLQKVKKNPNFVEFIEEYKYDYTPHLVMRYLQGPTLSKYVKEIHKSNGTLSSEEIRKHIEKIMNIIRFIHIDMDKVHRDITPSNFILIDDQVKMIDFGTISEDTGLEGDNRTGIQAGGYHSPEEAHGVSCKICDIYSLGSLMYFIVTGKDPPEPLPNMSTDRVMLHELRKINVNSDLEKIIMKARSFSPVERYQSINDLINDLIAYWYPGKRLCTMCGEMTSKVLTFCERCNSIICSNCGTGVDNKNSSSCPKCNSIICSRCGVASLENSKYCNKCGRGLQSNHNCETCSHPISYGAMFCRFCGEKVPIVV